jgi:DNA repair protein RadD
MIDLRWYQKEALDAIYNYYMTGNKGNILIGLPTGSGKSVLPAAFIHAIIRQWPNQRFLMITHVKELIEQNANVMLKIWPNAPLGIYSAGLKSKDTVEPIVFGGVQSMIKHPDWFGHRDIAFVDEAHLVSANDSSQYQTFFAQMKLINPNLKIIGMSATLYRMGMGMITENGLFTDVVYNMTDMNGFNRLVAEGFISPLIPRRTETELDVSNVAIQQGEFVSTQLQGAVDKAEVTYKALKELINASHDRRAILIFASGIAHAEHIAEQLGAFGITCAPVHSKRTADYNDRAIQEFKQGKLRAIVNYGKLTTGFDHPEIDLIGMLRPTMSVPLWVQMLGRGTRPANGKQNCLVLDFARNTPRLGPINDPTIPKKKGASAGEIPVKICDACGTYNHISAKVCCSCDAPFVFKQKLVAKAGNEELIRGELPIIQTYPVMNVTYTKHKNHFNDKPPTLKVTYFTNGLAYNEYICLEHDGFANKKARIWWRKRYIGYILGGQVPLRIDQALQYVNSLKVPKLIKVHVNKKYPEIIGVEF